MKLKRLSLQNIGCYKNLELSFIKTVNDGTLCLRNRTVILGNNGSGKSTILKSIALILSGSSALGELIGDSNNWINNQTDSGSISATLIDIKGKEIQIQLLFNRNDSLSKIISQNQTSLNQLDSLVQTSSNNALLVAYGVHRKVGGKLLKVTTSNYQHTRSEHVATLFDSEASLYPFEAWLMDIDYREGQAGLEKVKTALHQLVPDLTFYKIDKDNRSILFKYEDEVVTFSQLSDGIQIAINWLGDLLYRLSITYKDAPNILDTSFILLIDEIALHLHPSWQRKIIQSISSLFPNAQLIATTHSPFVAQQAGDSELFTIIRNKEDRLDLFQYQNDPRKLLLHQIVMSDIFGISTDESTIVERAKNESRKAPQKSRNLATKQPDQNTLTQLKGIDRLEELPIHSYSYENKDETDIISKLQAEIKRIKDDQAKS